MGQRRDGVEHPLALRCHPQATGTEALADIHALQFTTRRTWSRERAYTTRVLDEFESVETDARSRRGERHPRRRILRRILVAILALVLVLAVGVVGYLVFLNQTVSGNIQHEAMLPEPTPGVAGDDTAPVEGFGQNFLLIGSDARPGDTFSRSDVIIVAHVTEERDKIYLIHFPRDLYVKIPGHGKDKINAAYAFGQAPLLVSTLQDLVGLHIDHVAKIDFTGFENMTDAVGGVRVYANEPSVNDDGFQIQQGWNDLNGEQALGFVRERKELSEGDITRGQRQQAFLRALLVKSLSKDTITNPITLAKFIDAATSNTVVDEDFSIGDMRSEAIGMRGLRGDDVQFITAPFTGFGVTSAGASIDIVDQNGMRQLGEAIRTDRLDEYVKDQP
jgi:LCP family protein required for cell wall assembly